MRATRRRRGLTLLEVLVASTILVVILGLSFQAMHRSMQHGAHGLSIADARTKERQALARITRELQQSALPQIFREDAPGKGTYTTPLRTADGAFTAVRFKVCVGAEVNGDPKYEASPRGYRLDAATQKLRFLMPNATEIDVLDHVTAFTVAVDASGRVVVTITVSAPDPDGRRNGSQTAPPVIVTETASFVPLNS